MPIQTVYAKRQVASPQPRKTEKKNKAFKKWCAKAFNRLYREVYSTKFTIENTRNSIDLESIE